MPIDTYMIFLERGRELIAAQCCWIKLFKLYIQNFLLPLQSIYI